MSAFKGTALKIKKDDEIIFSGINSKDVTFNAELIDNTSGSTRGYRVLLEETDTKSIDIGFKGIAKNSVLRLLRYNDTNLLTDVTVEFANGDTITGDFMLGSYSESASFKDCIQFSCDLQSTGSYGHTFSPGGGGGDGGGGSDVAPLDNILNFIGRFSSAGYSSAVIEEGALPAIAPHFNILTGTVDTIYQRYRVYDPVSDAELINLTVCAIIANFAISCELTNDDSNGSIIVITPFFKDETIKILSDWSETTLQLGVDVSPITLGSDYSCNNIIVMSLDCFGIIKTLNTEALNVVTFDIVKFLSPTSREINEVSINLESLGYSDKYFSAGAPPCSVNIIDEEVSVLYTLISSDYSEGFFLNVVIDTVTFSIKSSELIDYVEEIHNSSLRGLTNPNDTCLELISSSIHYCRSVFSCQYFYAGETFTEYGKYLYYHQYSERTVNTEGEAVFSDVVGEYNFIMNPLVADKITSLGYTVSYLDGLTFGAIGVYIS